MPELISTAPVLLVRDIHAAANYYRDKLGFSYDKLWGDPPDFCMVYRNGITVMLSQVGSDATVLPHWQVVEKMWSAYFWVDDAKTLYEEFCQSGTKIDYELGMKPYGVLEFGVQDLDGHDLGFGEVIRNEG